MRTAMKEIDNDSPKTHPLKNRVKCISIDANHCSNENGFALSHEKDRKAVDERQEDGTDESVVSVNEIYQLGIEDKENNEVYLLDFVDSLKVSYSVEVPDTSQGGLEILPPFIHDCVFAEYLSCTASDVLSKISASLESWMDEVDEGKFISRHLAAFDELIILRKQIFTLLKLFVPNPDVREGFDCTTADLDRYLLRIIRDLSNNNINLGSEASTGYPVVSVCTEPEHCVHVLRQRVLTLLQTLLPNLLLPESFDLKRDLQDLINAIYSYNMPKF
ncbi:expressed conserved protein [Echinococcus multilocularis]|uniref:Expressed conserved protein n=1 Tax=Echinococcus multilocularis TaxID=6211 RepID=A0A087VWZ4_ECHMU|nr:expressed conserved protein [Echinococcus multilocularis]